MRSNTAEAFSPQYPEFPGLEAAPNLYEVKKVPHTLNLNPEQEKEWDNMTTQFAELVDGSMRTEFSFKLSPDGNELYGRDGRGVKKIARNYLEQAETLAKANPNMGWNLRRTELENEEASMVVDMAAGKGPNTMIVISDFPPELQGAKADFGGYNVTRKQTMLRVYTRRADGTGVDMVTRSLDRSDRQALEAVYEEFDIKPEPGELLGQRIQKDLIGSQQANLDDRLTGIYDRSIAERLGGVWYAGRRPADYRNTYDFVCREGRDLIAACLELDRTGQLTKEAMYNMAATMQKRFEQQQSGEVIGIIPRLETVNTASLSREIALAGGEARAAGKSFSACGETLTSDGEDSTEAQLKVAGLGKGLEGKGTKEWHGGTKHSNSECRSCHEVKKEVGACYICKDCVDNPQHGKIVEMNKTRAARRRAEEAKKAPQNNQESAEPAEVISLEAKRREKQTEAAKHIKLGATVQPPAKDL